MYVELLLPLSHTPTAAYGPGWVWPRCVWNTWTGVAANFDNLNGIQRATRLGTARHASARCGMRGISRRRNAVEAGVRAVRQHMQILQFATRGTLLHSTLLTEYRLNHKIVTKSNRIPIIIITNSMTMATRIRDQRYVAFYSNATLTDAYEL